MSPNAYRRSRAAVRAGLVAASATSISLTGCRDDEPTETAGQELLDLGAEQVAIGVRHVMTADGVRRAHLVADTAYFLDSESQVRFRQMRVDFFGDAGEEVSVLTALEGLIDLQTENMEAIGRVVVVDQAQSERLETERLEYISELDRLQSDVAFVFQRGDNTIRGQGFVSDPGLDTVRVTRPSAVTPRRGGGS